MRRTFIFSVWTASGAFSTFAVYMVSCSCVSVFVFARVQESWYKTVIAAPQGWGHRTKPLHTVYTV